LAVAIFLIWRIILWRRRNLALKAGPRIDLASSGGSGPGIAPPTLKSYVGGASAVGTVGHHTIGDGVYADGAAPEYVLDIRRHTINSTTSPSSRTQASTSGRRRRRRGPSRESRGRRTLRGMRSFLNLDPEDSYNPEDELESGESRTSAVTRPPTAVIAPSSPTTWEEHPWRPISIRRGTTRVSRTPTYHSGELPPYQA
jgi:hypothetical protein